MLVAESTELKLSDYKYDEANLHRVVEIYCEEGHTPYLKHHLKSWAKNKNHIYKLFGNKLKMEQEVDSFISKKEIEKIVLKFCKEIQHNVELSLVYNFLHSKIMDERYEEIASNYLQENMEYFGVKFNAGMKISRILPRLTTKKYSEWIQVEYSKIVQSFSVKGTAILSIDPVDYVTMSENTSGWRSCHALDGEYRTGTLAYMMDGTSVVAYVKTKDIVHKYGYTHEVRISDKMWRQMVFIETDSVQGGPLAVQSRQYPSKNSSNAGTISNMIIELFKGHTGNEYHMVKEESSELARIVEDVNSCNLWYNDITRGSFGKGRIILPKAFRDMHDMVMACGYPAILVGVEEIPCACGCNNYLEEADYLYYESRYDDEDDYYNEDEEQ